MQMVATDDGAEYVVAFVWVDNETQDMSICWCSDIMRSTDVHLVCIKTWECVYFPSDPTTCN